MKKTIYGICGMLLLSSMGITQAADSSSVAKIDCNFGKIYGLNGKSPWDAGGLSFKVNLSEKNVKTDCYPSTSGCILDGSPQILDLESVTSVDKKSPIFSTELNKNTADRLVIYGGTGDDTYLMAVISISQHYHSQTQSVDLIATATLTAFDLPDMTGASKVVSCETSLKP